MCEWGVKGERPSHVFKQLHQKDMWPILQLIACRSFQFGLFFDLSPIICLIGPPAEKRRHIRPSTAPQQKRFNMRPRTSPYAGPVKKPEQCVCIKSKASKPDWMILQPTPFGAHVKPRVTRRAHPCRTRARSSATRGCTLWFTRKRLRCV
jgi:hypothetical protein